MENEKSLKTIFFTAAAAAELNENENDFWMLRLFMLRA